MNILIVKYLPSGETSNTLTLLNYFKQNLGSEHNIIERDLIETPAQHFNYTSMKAYKMRNYGGQILTGELAESIQSIDMLTDEFMSADLVVLATPMHNFSLPGMIKLYFDAIMQNGKVFKYEDGKQYGLMTNTKFATIYTSMGSYKGEYGFMDNLKTILKIELDFMGIKDYQFIHAATGNTSLMEMQINRAKESIDALIDKWQL
ncbi:FMN-dependent NADH-azoreductase [Carboxylicivirga linearis]|uniref:FMN dependent NADH:quinone oxidoreductase n=1 Tax=Carboxylicivirga linearis TaxID=1628157 RepID=A0ABS5JT55_9BACT|nr:NAD(P)H-dependent oxidoreductase [Carboxylicivirga linearis]MBS2097556.1 NAD(P)H-dependent oxidoreductase [Carboxylicivirga linearis]